MKLRLLLSVLFMMVVTPVGSTTLAQVTDPVAGIGESPATPSPDDDFRANGSHDKPFLHKWESALDLKRTPIVEGGTNIVSFQWLRRWRTGTAVGLTFSALPFTVKRTVEDVDMKIGLLYYGGVLEQSLYESWPFRVALAVSGGQGQLYTRYDPPSHETYSKQLLVTFVEPAAYVYFYHYKHLDLGVTASSRIVKFSEEDAIGPDDVTGASYGITFRGKM